jgi:CheY-like chemotaxis protein
VNAAESSQRVHALSGLLQKALHQSTELAAMLPADHPARLEAQELVLELQRAAASARRLIADVAGFLPRPTVIAGKNLPSPDLRPTLLYVDDNPDRLKLLRARLEARGYHVITAPDGHEGLHQFLTNHVKLAILDYYMPTLDGGSVALQMRQLRSDIPILIFSGALTLPDRVMAAIDGFISTSEEPNVLLEKIAELVPVEQPKAS